MPRPRRRKLRAGDQIRYTIPTPELAAYLERWGPGGMSQAITAGLMLLMHTGREPGSVVSGPGAPGGGAGREGNRASPPSEPPPPPGGPGEEKPGPSGQDSTIRRLALSAFE